MSGDLAMLLAEPPFASVQHVYSSPGSAVENIPAGYSTCIMETWGSPGAGGAGVPSAQTQGGGGASGSYCRSSYSVVGQGGKTVNYTVAAPADQTSSIASGTFAITAMNAPGGGNGGAATVNSGGTGGVAGAAATGGNQANSAGNSGSDGESPSNPHLGRGGNGIAGAYGTGSGGANGSFTLIGNSASAGLVVFTYLP